MIADIKVDLSIFKTVLLDVVKKNSKLISSGEYEILKVLYNEYEPKNNIDINQLENYKCVFKNYYADKCIDLASFHDDENNQVDVQKIKELEGSGRLFNVNTLKVFMRQLYFEMRLLGEDNSFLIAVLIKLCDCLGSAYYYDIAKLDELFVKAIYLYLSDKKISASTNPEWKSIANSMKDLLCLYSFNFEIQNGSINFLDSYDEIIQSMIEKRISIIGGVEFLKWIFFEEIKPLNNKEINRFLIHKNSKQFVLEIKDLRIPYNYLIQLAAKNIGKSKLLVITNKELQKIYKDTIKIGKDFLNVLDIQSYFIHGDIIRNYKDIPRKLSKNILFEKMFTPIQYSPDFTKIFINEIYIPFIKKANNLGYSLNDFIVFSDYFLSEKRFCVSYSFEELLESTGIRRTNLSNILDDFSFDFKDVNKEFNSFLMPTNYRLKPLIKLPNEKYFFFSAYFNGFSFCEALYSKLQPYYPGNFNRLKGHYIEEMFKKLFLKKGFIFHSGKYQADKNTVLECDMIFESSNDIVFFEIKNQPLPDSFEQGDDVETLYSLGEGMIKAQKQCCKHVFNLQNKGQITIEDNNNHQYTLKQNGRRIICISVCSQEYLFLTNKIFSQTFMESLLRATYHAKDQQKEHRLNKLNSLRDSIKKVVSDIYGANVPKHVFHNTLFRSMQQIYSAINLSNTVEDFEKFLSNAICCIDGSGDVYCQLLNCLNMSSVCRTPK